MLLIDERNDIAVNMDGFYQIRLEKEREDDFCGHVSPTIWIDIEGDTVEIEFETDKKAEMTYKYIIACLVDGDKSATITK